MVPAVLDREAKLFVKRHARRQVLHGSIGIRRVSFMGDLGKMSVDG
jgi:hypothetical protein